MWCGWLFRSKANRGVHAQDDVHKFRHTIQAALGMGRNYSHRRPEAEGRSGRLPSTYFLLISKSPYD
jgi:hypothetical protein